MKFIFGTLRATEVGGKHAESSNLTRSKSKNLWRLMDLGFTGCGGWGGMAFAALSCNLRKQIVEPSVGFKSLEVFQ